MAIVLQFSFLREVDFSRFIEKREDKEERRGEQLKSYFDLRLIIQQDSRFPQTKGGNISLTCLMMYEMDYRFNPKLVLGRKISGFDKDTSVKTCNYSFQPETC